VVILLLYLVGARDAFLVSVLRIVLVGFLVWQFVQHALFPERRHPEFS